MVLSLEKYWLNTMRGIILMDRKEVVLDNGVKLLMINTNKFKTVDVRVFFEDELNEMNVTCNNLLLKLLSTKTGEHRSRKSFKNYLEKMYDMKVKTMVSLMGETFSASVGVNALNKKYTMDNENLLKNQFLVLNEVLNKPLANNDKFDDEYFNEIKKVYREELIDSLNYKEVVVKNKVSEILGEDNKAFTISEGNLHCLEQLDNKSVYDKYLSFNKSCKFVVVVGEINFDEVETYVNKYLPVSNSRFNNNYIYKNDLRKYDDISFDSKFNQASIGILYDLDIYLGEELYYPAIVFVEMFNYYLFKIVREEHNFCYSIYTTYLGSRGLCYLQSNIESKNYEMTLKLIEAIIEDLRGELDSKVFEICKNKVINGIKKEEDSSMKMMTREYFKQVYSLKDNDEIVEIINNVNCDKINEVAKRFQKKFSVILKEGN